MADITKTIEIVFGAVDNASGTFKGVTDGLGKLSDGVANATQPIADFTESLFKIEGAVIAAGVALAGFAVNEAGKFSDAMNEIGTLFEGTPEQIKKLGDEVLVFASKSTSSFEDIQNATYSAISAGVAWEDSVSAITEAEKLATVGKADLNSTTVALISTLNAYGEKSDQAAKYADILFTTVKKGQTTLPELASSLSQVTTLAANAGIPFEEVAASIAALTAAGAPTTEAMTLIKGAISNIIKPSKEAAELAAELGIEFNASALESKGFSAVLQDVAKATGGNTEQMALFFGSVRGLTGTLALTGVAADAFTADLEAMKDSAGAVTTAMETMGNNFALINQNLANNFFIPLKRAGLEMLDQYKGIAEGVTAVFKSIDAGLIKGSFDPVLDFINSAGADLEEFLKGVAKALPDALAGVDYTGLISAFEKLGANIGALFGDLDLTKPEDLTKVLQGVVDVLTVITDYAAGAVKGLEPFVQTIKDIIAGNQDWIKENSNLLGEIGGTLTAINKIAEASGSLVDALQGIGLAIGGIAGAVGLKALITGLGSGSTAMAALGASSSSLLTILGASATVGLWGAVIGLGAAAAYAAGEGIAKLANTMGLIGEDSEAVENALAKQSAELAKYNYETQEAAKWLDDFNKSLNLGEYALKDSEVTLANSAETLVHFSAALEEAGIAFQETGDGISFLGDKVEESTDGLSIASNKLNGFSETVYDLDGNVVKLGGTFSNYKSAITSATEETKKAQEETEKIRITMLELASDERIKAMEFTADIKVAEIEADAQKAVAAFDSIGESVSSTNDLIGTLSGSFLDAQGLKKYAIEDLMDDANDRANDLTEAQIRLLDAEAARMEAQADSLRNGDAVITVQADGVEPEIEAFMFKILDKVRVKMAAEDQAYLLGVGG